LRTDRAVIFYARIGKLSSCMLIPKIKICGITNLEDALACVEMGADLLGFNFYRKSPRFVAPDKAAEIIDRLPGFVDVTGVFVNAAAEEIRSTVKECKLDWIQLHGDETPDFCRSFLDLHTKTMKALRVREESDIDKAEDYFTDAILLDAFDSDKYGGTGKRFDWNVIGHIGKRVFLAGGINPDNVCEALKLGIYGIDVCSGIEAGPGKKDHKKLKRLFDNINHLRG